MASTGDQQESARNFLDEAKRILAGTTGLLPERRHLEALQELHECALIRIACKLKGVIRDDVMNSE